MSEAARESEKEGMMGMKGERERERGRDDDPLNAAAQSMARLDRRFTDAISVLSTRFRHRPRLGNVSAGQLTDSLLHRYYHAA